MSHALKLGFGRPVQDSQAVFRTVMMAMARPGDIRTIDVDLDPPGRLGVAAAALALALCDFETPVWLAPGLSGQDGVAEYLRFHTGAPLVQDPAKAHFAFLGGGESLPDFSTFSLGTLAYPDRATTLVVEVDTLADDGGFVLAGPGIAGKTHLRAAPLPDDLAARLADNRSLFPRGVDLVLTCGDRLAAIPRSTIVDGEG